MKIIKVSPKGQITIPKQARENGMKIQQYLFELHGKTIVLRPISFQIIDELKDFSGLAEKSFDFWNGDEDDIYQTFYTK